jgi:tetratricopeptide (TPR) repeat protein
MKALSLAFVVLACSSTPSPRPVAPASAPAPAVATTAAPEHAERFDEKVRQDFFDGLRGDTAALDRAMALCDAALAKNPRDPEAMVWHGAGLIARSVPKFRSGDAAGGVPLYMQGLSEMNRAVALAPNNIGVRIPRGAVLLGMAPFVPADQKQHLLADAISDYEAALAKQEPRFAKLSLHAREQLLYGLTDAYASLGNLEKARAYYQRMTSDAAGSELLARAKARADGEKVDGATPCQQCHAAR